MFDFQYVELMNWAYWPTVKLPLDQRTIMITGPNGSGKTTFLDALRTLLRVPKLSSSRHFTDYLIGNVEAAAIKAVVSNGCNGTGRRPFEFKGHVGDLVTLAVMLRRKSGRWEKQFAILDGDVPFDSLKDLPSAETLTPTTYSYELHEAGFANALIKVLALEQGQTDQLCNKSPRELLDLLLEVHGDKEILERYKNSRENYQVACMEMTHIGARLAEEQAKLLMAQKAAEECQRFEKLNTELAELENVFIPQAEYVAAGRRIEELNLAIEDNKLHLNPLDREIVAVETQLENAETELARRKNQVLEAREQKESVEKDERELDIKLVRMLEERTDLETLLTATATAKAEPIEPLKDRLLDIRKALVRLELEQEQTKHRVDMLGHEADATKTGQHKIYPMYVTDYINALAEKNIGFRLLCDIIEITDQKWQLAIESIIGRDRFDVLVRAKDQLAARELGEKYRYRAYIVEWDESGSADHTSASKQAALSFVKFTEPGVPTWIVDALDETLLVASVKDGMQAATAGTVTVTRKGYRQDRRGGVSIAVDHFFCGSLGQDARKEEIETEIEALDKRLKGIEGQAAKKQTVESDLVGYIAIQENLGRAQEAAERKNVLDDEIRRTNESHHQALQVRRQAEHKLIDALDAFNNFERDCEDQRKWVASKRNDQSEFLNETKELQTNIRQLKDQRADIEAKLSADHLREKALKNVPDIDELTPRYYAVQSRLEEFEEPPEESAVQVFEQFTTQYERQRQIYSDHEAGLRNWENEFRLARQKYMVVVEHTIREYRKNILALAEIAGVSAEVVTPDLGEHEERLDDAELLVRFGYDGKRALDISGAGHSGGQRVVSSLILLMSLATSGGGHGGFFIIDEPFAHLSIERIDDVSGFLDKSRCQFILTSPTTHNVNVFSAARLQLNFRIKKQDEAFAPVPTIIRR